MAQLENLPSGIEISWLASQDEYFKWEKESDFSGRRAKEKEIINLLKNSRKPYVFLEENVFAVKVTLISS